MKKSKKYLIFSIICVVLIYIDQLTKKLALNLINNDIVLIPNVLELHYLENTGAAFSSFNGMTWLFIVTTPLILAILIYFFVKSPFNKTYMPLLVVFCFLIAGAIGNYIDRVINHYVIDFIYFSLIDFPVFNVADIYVTCSIVVLFILILFHYKESDFEIYKIKK